MSEDTQAPEAPKDVTIDAPAATVEPEHESLLEKVEDVVGGILGDHPRTTLKTHEDKALAAGEAVISRDQLAEIEKRGAVSDIRLLVAACRKLLDELEAPKAEA